MCKPPGSGLTEQVQCRGLKPTVTCTVFNAAVLDPMLTSKGGFVINKNIVFLDSTKLVPSASCPSPSYTDLGKKFTIGVFKSLSAMQPVNERVCKHWVNGTTFISTLASIHIYFKVIGWYNLYKAILESGASENISNVKVDEDGLKYLFLDFEQSLFPNMTNIRNFGNGTVCFKKLVVIPHYYDSPQFQCKMSTSMRERCFKCNGRGKTETEMMAFRSAVLGGCSINDSVPTSTYQDPRRIVVILRKPYKRWSKDKPENFQRCLKNSEELLSGLKSHFPQANVTGIYPEDMDICSQIRTAHDADILMGVHGAGLVHLWWLRHEALIVELVPSYEESNPTFKMLSTLTGRNYRALHVSSGNTHAITVDIKEVIRILNS